nr:hypothetical protein [Ruminococcus sp.]
MLSDVAAPPVAEVGFTEIVPTVAGSPVGAVGSSDCDDFSTRTAQKSLNTPLIHQFWLKKKQQKQNNK